MYTFEWYPRGSCGFSAAKLEISESNESSGSKDLGKCLVETTSDKSSVFLTDSFLSSSLETTRTSIY